VVRLTERLQVNPDVIRSYGRRAKTRTDHLRWVAKDLGCHRNAADMPPSWFESVITEQDDIAERPEELLHEEYGREV
jgi:hypothetical protein